MPGVVFPQKKAIKRNMEAYEAAQVADQQKVRALLRTDAVSAHSSAAGITGNSFSRRSVDELVPLLFLWPCGCRSWRSRPLRTRRHWSRSTAATIWVLARASHQSKGFRARR